MTDAADIVITGAGALCAAGRHPDEIWDAVLTGRSALAPIAQWDVQDWPRRLAGEIPDYDPVALLRDRKIQKLIRRADVLGLYAAREAIAASGLTDYRDGLDEAAAAQFNDRTGVYVGSGGGSYASQNDFFPLLAESQGELPAFGQQLPDVVNPMWLLRSLPNNVLCHVGIRHGFKGPNACITHHSIGGTLSLIEAVQALRCGEAERAVAIGHDSSIEPLGQMYFHQFGLLAREAVRSFDVQRDGSIFGEGAAALVLETRAAAQRRGAAALGTVLGGACASDAAGLMAIDADGQALEDAIRLALDDAGLAAGDVGMIVAHANGTPQSDASEAAALLRVFGDDAPPVTGFKWAFGHLLAASGALEAIVALAALRAGIVPGIPTLRQLDPACAGLPVSAQATAPRSDIALTISRGFGGTNAVLLLRSGDAT